MDVKYIVLCKASREHFTFDSLSSLMDFLDPAGDEDLQPHDYHNDLRIFSVAQELRPLPKEQVPKLMVRNWFLRAKTC